MSEEILHEKIKKNLYDKGIFADIPEIPKYIRNNLKHELRLYQEKALEHLLHVESRNSNNINYFGKHFLFHMATGSGKTMILAALILYYYKKLGYQNFMFFVNSDAIVRKTRDNLTNDASPKYLFDTNGIEIDGQKINIQLVEVFPSLPDENTIYLKVTSIQKLHQLEQPKENSLTYDALAEFPTVLFSDEAHHINVETNRRRKNESNQVKEERNWERTVNKILNSHPKNKLIEFTATLDLTQNALFEKYKDKIIFQYELKEFMNDQYSKNVFMAKANEDDDEKMLGAVLLSQYRKYIAKEINVDLKPIILFKSNYIPVSTKSKERFDEIIDNLSVDVITEKILRELPLHKEKGNVWEKMYGYYEGLDLHKVVNDIKLDFTKDTILKVDTKELLSEKNAILLNTLEDINNPIRAIFAVSKLNEGWDVLNLFDIVRISERSSTTRNATDSEAQLIGRGARYFPFSYSGERSYKRRFDYDNKRYSILESIHYHTLNENSYISNLMKSLDKEGIVTREDRSTLYKAKVKEKFKKVINNGIIYKNEEKETTKDDYQSLEDYKIEPHYYVPFEIAEETKYGDRPNSRNGEQLDRFYETEFPLDRRIIQKAIQRNKFFRFQNLSKFVPTITSVKEFIESPNFLGKAKITVTLPIGWTLDDITPKRKLKIVEKFIQEIEQKISKNYNKKIGTPKFVGHPMDKYIHDYELEINRIQYNNTTDIRENIQSYSMNHYKWFVYDYALVNGWERNLIDEIAISMNDLRKKYGEIYLIRNERKILLREIGGPRGFMPDFLLILKDEEFTYHVFIEPKGSQLAEKDRWKEKFLISLSENEEIEILHESENVKLIGLKFYSEEWSDKEAFKEDFRQKLLADVKLEAKEQDLLSGFRVAED